MTSDYESSTDIIVTLYIAFSTKLLILTELNFFKTFINVMYLRSCTLYSRQVKAKIDDNAITCSFSLIRLIRLVLFADTDHMLKIGSREFLSSLIFRGDELHLIDAFSIIKRIHNMQKSDSNLRSYVIL